MSENVFSGQRCLIRIAATLQHVEGDRGYTVNYMGSEFIVSQQETVEIIDRSIVVAEVMGRVIKSTGNASYLVRYQGHALRVHAQQIRTIEEVSCD